MQPKHSPRAAERTCETPKYGSAHNTLYRSKKPPLQLTHKRGAWLVWTRQDKSLQESGWTATRNDVHIPVTTYAEPSSMTKEKWRIIPIKNCRLVTSQQPLISIQKLCFYENYKRQTQVYLNSPPYRFPYHARHLHPHQTQGGNYHSENVCASLPNSRSPARYTNCWSCLKNNSSWSSLCAQE